jgi:1-acyl-sn-glycerol-3-phosphate acyltransferase
MIATLNNSFKTKQIFSNLVELLRDRAQQQPDNIAFIYLKYGEIESTKLTYQELDRQARAIAIQLRQIAQPGERALLLYPSSLDFITAFFGCLYAQVIAVPAYPPRANQNLLRIKTIVADAQATVALTTTSLLSNLTQRWTVNLESAKLHWLATDNVDDNLALLWREPMMEQNTLAFLQYTSGSTGNPKGVMVTHRNILHNEQMIATAFEHNEKTISVGWLPLFHDMGLIGNVLQPLYLGLPCLLMSPIDFLQKPFRWLDAISRYKATSSGGPNFAYDLCLRKITKEQRSQLDLSSWDVAFTGAEPIRAETLTAFTNTFSECGFRHQAFYPCYGMAEATLFITGSIKNNFPVVQTVDAKSLTENRVVIVNEVVNKDINTRKIVSCGRSELEQKVIIVHPELLTQLASGEVGEIWVKSPSVAAGYWNNLEQTTKTFHAYLVDSGEASFLRTGDLGFILDEELFVTGRLKDVIIIRGRNHYPQDIEATVENSHPLIKKPNCCAAIAVEIAGEERLVIVVELERRYRQRSHQPQDQVQNDVEVGYGVDIEEVVGRIRSSVAHQHELQVYGVQLLKPGGIPKTSSGKIQRHACRDSYEAGTLDAIHGWLEENLNIIPQHSSEHVFRYSQVVSSCNQEYSAATIQTWLAARVAVELKVKADKIDTHQSLIQYGLDSVQLVSIVAALEDWLGCQLSPSLLEDYPQIDTLSQYLANKLSQSTIQKPNSNNGNAFNNIYTWLQKGLSYCFVSLEKIIYNNYFHISCQGFENIPQDTPFLIAANHTSHLDRGAIAVSLSKYVNRIFSLGAKDYFFDNPIKSWFFRTFLNLIPFDRQGSFKEAIQQCQQVLVKHQSVLIFPEGTRSINGELQQFQAGVGLLALKLNVPIVPVYIHGTNKALPKGHWFARRSKIHVICGTPIEILPYKEKLNTFTERDVSQNIANELQTTIVQLQNKILN